MSLDHVVGSVVWTSGSNGWVTCTCKEVVAATDFPAHRKAAGATGKNIMRSPEVARGKEPGRMGITFASRAKGRKRRKA